MDRAHLYTHCMKWGPEESETFSSSWCRTALSSRRERGMGPWTRGSPSNRHLIVKQFNIFQNALVFWVSTWSEVHVLKTLSDLVHRLGTTRHSPCRLKFLSFKIRNTHALVAINFLSLSPFSPFPSTPPSLSSLCSQFAGFQISTLPRARRKEEGEKEKKKKKHNSGETSYKSKIPYKLKNHLFFFFRTLTCVYSNRVICL